jgi:outer membrane protein W
MSLIDLMKRTLAAGLIAVLPISLAAAAEQNGTEFDGADYSNAASGAGPGITQSTTSSLFDIGERTATHLRSESFSDMSEMYASEMYAQRQAGWGMPARYTRNVDFIGSVVWAQFPGGETFGVTRGEIDNATGFGLAMNAFMWDRVSLGIAASFLRPDATFSPTTGFQGPRTGRLRMIPMSANLQWHFNPVGGIDPYAGAGVTYALFDDVGNLTGPGNLTAVEFDDSVGWNANFGALFRFGAQLGLNVEGRYISVDPAVRPMIGLTPAAAETNFRVSPWLLSAGLRWGF